MILVLCSSCALIVRVWSAAADLAALLCPTSLLLKGSCKDQDAKELPVLLPTQDPAPLKALPCVQGYGGGSAVGGGQTGGDQFTSDEPSGKRQGQDAAYSGDQTDLDAGADTNFGVSAFQSCFHYPAMLACREAWNCC